MVSGMWRLLCALLDVAIVGRRGIEVLPAARTAAHGFADLVDGAQVEDEVILASHDLVAQLAGELWGRDTPSINSWLRIEKPGGTSNTLLGYSSAERLS